MTLEVEGWFGGYLRAGGLPGQRPGLVNSWGTLQSRTFLGALYVDDGFCPISPWLVTRPGLPFER